MVAVPTRQSRIASVCEQKFECRRFNMTVTKHHVGLALGDGYPMPCTSVSLCTLASRDSIRPINVASPPSGNGMPWVSKRQNSPLQCVQFISQCLFHIICGLLSGGVYPPLRSYRLEQFRQPRFPAPKALLHRLRFQSARHTTGLTGKTSVSRR